MSVAKPLLLLAIALVTVPAAAQNIGKTLFERDWEFEPRTEVIPKSELPLRATTEEQKKLKKIVNTMRGDGLGPMHNATSCEACHAKGGAAGVDHNVTTLTLDPRSPLIKTIIFHPSFSRVDGDTAKHARSELNSLFPGLVSAQGNTNFDIVVHEHSSLEPDAYQDLREKLFEAVPDIDPRWVNAKQRTSELIASEPVLAGRKNEIDFYLSQRNPPPLYGLGVIDRISDKRLQNIAESQARTTGGRITGRRSTGKFGWRGQALDLSSFVRGACAGELGLQVSNIGQAQDPINATYVSLGNDLSDDQVQHLTNYIRFLPAPRVHGFKSNKNTIRTGKKLFASVGCAHCHIEDISPAKGIYSDLLLHDMGIALQAPSPSPAPPSGRGRTVANIADQSRIAGIFGRRRRADGTAFEPDYQLISNWMRSDVIAYYGAFSRAGARIPEPYALDRPATPQFPYGEGPEEQPNTASKTGFGTTSFWDSLQREWRTPPLWGVADSAPYLHDGRAKTLEEAIHWHGGEARDSATAFKKLSGSDRETLLSFLLSLRAPTAPDRIAKKQESSTELPEEVAAASSSAEPDSSSVDSVLDVFSSGY